MSKLPKLTKEQVAEYKANGGTLCPYCKSADIEGDSLEVDSNMAWQTVSCANCDAEWNDVYEFCAIEETA